MRKKHYEIRQKAGCGVWQSYERALKDFLLNAQKNKRQKLVYTNYLESTIIGVSKTTKRGTKITLKPHKEKTDEN